MYNFAISEHLRSTSLPWITEINTFSLQRLVLSGTWSFRWFYSSCWLTPQWWEDSSCRYILFKIIRHVKASSVCKQFCKKQTTKNSFFLTPNSDKSPTLLPLTHSRINQEHKQKAHQTYSLSSVSCSSAPFPASILSGATTCICVE